MPLCAIREEDVLSVRFGFGPTPFGRALVAWTEGGVCHLAFATASDAGMVQALQQAWPKAVLVPDDPAATTLLARALERAAQTGTLNLVVRGTPFQIRVWEALLRTQPGEVLTYGELAQRIGAPRAARAVGSALAANEIGWLIPCHRVVRTGGQVGHYRWQAERKAAMLDWEARRRSGD